MNLKSKVVEILEKNGQSQVWLAEKLGISYSSFFNTITKNPTVKWLDKLADVLNVPYIEMFADDTSQYKEVTFCKDSKDISKRIVEILTERGLTRNDLAEMLNVSNGTITAYLSGSTTIKQFEKIASVLELDICDIMYRPNGFKSDNLYLENVNRICKRKGIKVQDLSDNLGITYSALYYNVNKGNLEIIKKISEVLNIQISDIIGEEIQENKKEIIVKENPKIIDRYKQEENDKRSFLRIKEVLFEKGIKYYELEKHLGVSRPTLTALLDNPNIPLSRLVQIADFCGVPVTELLDKPQKHFCPHCGKPIKINLS